MAANQAAATRKFRRVYSISFAHTAMEGRRKPSDFEKEQFAVLATEVHTQCFQRQVRAEGVPPNKVENIMVFKERHADGQWHIYGVVECTRPYGAMQMQRALQQQRQVYTSFGTDHTYFWTAVIYAAIPSEHKAPQEMDPAPFHSSGRTLREVLADIPRGARAADRTKVLAFLGLEHRSNAPKAATPVSDLAERIRTNNWTSAEQLAVAAGRARDDDPEFYQAMLAMGSRKAEEFIKWVWAMEGGVQEPVVDRLDKLRHTSQTAACVCGGQWATAVEQLLLHQGICSETFRAHVLRALRLGRKKGTNVLITGAPDAGKSFAIKPLVKIFNAFITRGQRERFPLQGLPGSEIVYLQDVRFDSFGLCWDDWLRWGEDEPLMINLPRNDAGAKSVRYEGTAPLFASMADIFSFPLDLARREGRNVEKENRQFRSRWQIIDFTRAIPEAHRNVDLEPCPRCAACWYLHGYVSFDPLPAWDVGLQASQRSVRARLA